jgi:F-type H+-transporting ATPase subunit delta
MEPRPNKKTARQKASPYARAAFSYANRHDCVKEWEETLHILAEVFRDPELKNLPHDPRLDAAQLKSVMDKVLDELDATKEQRHLVDLLIRDKKLSLLPWVHEGFVRERKRAEGTAEVTIWSAQPLTEAQAENLKATLKKRFNAKAEPAMKVDPELIGGVKIEIGDRVYDQTVKGQLERLQKHLKKGPGAP